MTDFVKSQTDGVASFMLVQDFRWDVKLPEKTPGDLQNAGLRVASRESTTGPKLRVLAIPVPTTFSAEFESLTVAGTSGDSYATKSDTAASGGKSILMRSNAVGDYMTFALNVPVADGKVSDATRLTRLVPGLEALARRGARVIVISHFGRPKGRDRKSTRLNSSHRT